MNSIAFVCFFLFGSSLFSAAAFIGKRCCSQGYNTCYGSNYHRRLPSSYAVFSALPKTEEVDLVLSSSSGNLLFLQECFNFTEEWLANKKKMKTHDCFDKMNRSVALERLDWLEKRLELTKKDLAFIVGRRPQILRSNPDTSLGPTIDAFMEQLALNTTQLTKMVKKVPDIIQCSRGNLQHMLFWLRDRVCLNNTETLVKIVQRTPVLLLLSIDNNLVPTLKLLQERLNTSDTQLARLYSKAPEILACNYTTGIEPKLNWLQERLGLDNIQLARIVTSQPQLIMNSIPRNLDPTLIFFKECLGEECALAYLKKNPSSFGYSLEKRLKPRREQLQKAGIQLDVSSVRRMCMYTEKKWNASLGI